MVVIRTLLVFFGGWLLSVAAHSDAGVANLNYELIKVRSHVPSTFTQGLEIHAGEFYESSGLYGQSYLARYPIADTLPPIVLKAPTKPQFTEQYALAPELFAEGLTIAEDKLYLLSWREKNLQIFSLKPFRHEQTLRYQGEGWGLAFDGSQLIRSDGSHHLFFHARENFKLARQLPVTYQGAPLDRLNELEYHAGLIYANRWFDTTIYQIDPTHGRVVGVIDLAQLAAPQLRNNAENVLNGIAWDEVQQGFWVTGKRWNKMYLIRLAPSQTNEGNLRVE